MIKYKLLPGVVNVLVDFVMKKNNMKFTKGFVEKIASHWARKEIKTVKAAMELAREEVRSANNLEKRKTTGKNSKYKPIRTEVLPDWFEEHSKEVLKDTSNKNNTEVEEKKRAMEEKLKAFRK